MPAWKVKRFCSVWTATTKNCNKSFTHRSSWQRGFGADSFPVASYYLFSLNPSHQSKRIQRSDWVRVWVWCTKIPIFTSNYFLPSQWVPVFHSCPFTFAMVRRPVHSATKSCKTPFDRYGRSTFKIGGAQLRSVTEIASKSPSVHVCANRGTIRYGSRVGIAWTYPSKRYL